MLEVKVGIVHSCSSHQFPWLLCLILYNFALLNVSSTSPVLACDKLTSVKYLKPLFNVCHLIIAPAPLSCMAVVSGLRHSAFSVSLFFYPIIYYLNPLSAWGKSRDIPPTCPGGHRVEKGIPYSWPSPKHSPFPISFYSPGSLHQMTPWICSTGFHIYYFNNYP